MPQDAWSTNRRQFEQPKGGWKAQGKPENLAQEIAARTVNEERARKQKSKRPQDEPKR